MLVEKSSCFWVSKYANFLKKAYIYASWQACPFLCQERRRNVVSLVELLSRPARFFRARYAISFFKYAKNMLFQNFALVT